jgi:hypothetical protein
VSIERYYSKMESIREGLAAGGHTPLAEELLAAERSAATSVEALSNTGRVLRRIQRSSEIADPALRTEVAAALDLGHAIWEGRAQEPVDGRGWPPMCP